jgi:hypothetical protein
MLVVGLRVKAGGQGTARARKQENDDGDSAKHDDLPETGAMRVDDH